MPPIRLSVLDRIARAAGPPAEAAAPASIDDLRRDVIRNLEWVLNRRRGRAPLPDLLEDSLLGYGLPEFDIKSLDESSVRDRIADTIAAAIRRFEPRLTGVSVEIEPSIGKDLRLRARLSAALRAEPDDLPFAVQALLDINTREVVVT
ncbi:MAG: type VI secretion system baseplate subunit TssE [Thermoleophilia bacterium]|nr:type VI secretion system baseplate subunit TssE [Thermoleophilia bacterium]